MNVTENVTLPDGTKQSQENALSAPPAEYVALKERFGEAVLRYGIFRGDLTITVDPAVIVPALKTLRDEYRPSYNYLSFVTADHWIEPETPPPLEPPVFEIVYGLQTLPSPGTRLRLVVVVPDTPDAALPSVTEVHPGANWHEREVFDLFGVKFTGHPNLTRILTPETYPEHPLRRDFPHGGPALLEFHDRMVAQWNVAEERDYVGKFGDPWITKVIEQQTGRIGLERIGHDAVGDRDAESPGDIAHREKGPDR